MMTRRKDVLVHLVCAVLILQKTLANPCSGLQADYYDGKCFRILWEEFQPTEAQAKCKNWINGGQLAEPRTDPQFMFLRMIAFRDKNISTIGSIYIAGGRVTPTANLTWPNGDPVTLTYWIDGNPDNARQTEQCIELNAASALLLNDLPCSYARFYACEYHMGDICESHLTDNECFGGQCFKIYNEYAYWDDAINICAKDGAILAEPKTEDIFDFLAMFIDVNLGPYRTDAYLIGLTDYQEEGVFRWLSDNELLALDKWSKGEPNNFNIENQVLISSQTDGLMDANAKNELHPFICQKDALHYTYTYLAVITTDITQDQTVATLTIAASDQGITFIKIAQADGLMTGSTKVYTHTEAVGHLSQGSFVRLEELSYITVSGISSSFVEVKSTGPVTVLMYYEIFSPFEGLTGTAGTLILPTSMLTQNYFVLSDSTIPMKRLLTVTALENNTDVTIKMSSQVNQDAAVTVGRIVYKLTNHLTLSLHQYETLLIETTEIAGCFIHGSKPIAVFTTTEMVISGQAPMSDIALDMLIPTDYMDTEYVTFPVWPYPDNMTSSTSVDKIQLLALQNNTVVQIHGADTETVALATTGEFKEISLSSSNFYYMESNVPFHASRLSSDAAVGCTSHLIPSSLWSTEYNVMPLPTGLQTTVMFIIGELTKFNYTFETQNEDCLPINGTRFYGCVLGRVRFPVVDKVYKISSLSPFVVYQAWIDDNQKTRSCFPWGVNFTGVVPNLMVKFDGEAYLNQSDPRCVVPSTVMEDSTTTVSVTNELTTVEDLTPTSSFPPSSTAWGDTSTINTDSLSTTELNVSDEAEKFKAYIRQHLYIDVKDTGSYKRSKLSSTDSRVSCTVIGSFGAVIIAVVSGLIVLADITRFCTCAKIKPEASGELNG